MSPLSGFLILVVSLTALVIAYLTKQFQEENIIYSNNNQMKNTKVNRFFCEIFWYLFIINRLIISIGKSIRIIYRISIKENNISSYPNFAYFRNTKKGSMITDKNNLGCRNLLYWYLKWQCRDASIDHILCISS